jgi:hypothetical protein
MVKQLEHYLISLPVAGGYMHTYVMTNNQSVLPRVFGTMLNEVEKNGIGCPLSSTILQTHLTSGVETVRDVIKEIKAPSDDVEGCWKTAKDFHITMWCMPDDDPRQQRLMDLH